MFLMYVLYAREVKEIIISYFDVQIVMKKVKHGEFLKSKVRVRDRERRELMIYQKVSMNLTVCNIISHIWNLLSLLGILLKLLHFRSLWQTRKGKTSVVKTTSLYKASLSYPGKIRPREVPGSILLALQRKGVNKKRSFSSMLELILKKTKYNSRNPWYRIR